VEDKQIIKIKATTQAELRSAFTKVNLDGIDLDVITKKQIIQSRPCTDSILTK
jgi:hypothetical protein